VNKQFKKSL